MEGAHHAIKYEGLQPPEMRRLKQLEDENAKLKKLVADLSDHELRGAGCGSPAGGPSRRTLLPPSTSGNASIENWKEILERGRPFVKVW